MSKETEKIIKDAGFSLLNKVKGAIPSASGKTADSINLKFTPTGFVIRGGQQIEALIDGRKPTRKGAKKGSPTLQQEILSWIKAKRISPTGNGMTREGLSWAISKSIHNKGYKGKGNIFKDVVTASSVASMSQNLLKSETTSIQSSVIKEFKSK